MKQLFTVNERLENGVGYLTDTEALAILTGIDMPIIRDAVKAYGFHGLIHNIDCLRLSHDEKIQLQLVYNVCQRIGKSEVMKRTVISNPDDIAQLFVNELQFEPVEIVAIALLDVRCQLIKIEKITIGSVSTAVVHQRDIVRRAILYNASNVLISHNHPSGVLIASASDIAMTKALNLALETMDIHLLDHILVGNNNYVSLKKEGKF